ncbi:hypothetical protein Tco_1136711 [Tanacetum coccineum]
MESLHLSFKNAVHVGLYKSIHIDDSLILSHLFYADDVVFVGKWDKQNVAMIVNVLKCFFLAPGLKINLHKSKLMGIGIPQEEVRSAAASIGYSTFVAPFNFLDVKVGGLMSRRSSWEEKARVDWLEKDFGLQEKRKAWCFAFNRALLFKWIWRFIYQDSSLWVRVIQAMYGMRGALDSSHSLPACSSYWIDIIREIKRLSLKDVPLKHIYPRVFMLELDKNISIDVKMRDASLISSFRRVPRCGIKEDQSSGDFSVKSARSFIDDSLLPKADVPTRWVKVVPIKIYIFGWRVCLDKLPKRLNLSLRGVDIPFLCVESSSHLLFSCRLAHSLMHKLARWWDLDIQDFNSYGDWLV